MTPPETLRKTPIRVIYNDVDNTLVNNGYDTTGAIQEGPDAETNAAFAAYRIWNATVDVPIVLVTNRGRAATEGIIKRGGFGTKPNYRKAICEGVGILDTGDGSYTFVGEVVSELHSKKEFVPMLAEIRDTLHPELEKIGQEICAGHVPIISPGKQFSLAWDIPYTIKREEGEMIGSSARVNADAFYMAIKKSLDEKGYRKFVAFSHDEPVTEESKSKPLQLTRDNSAVNLRLTGLDKRPTILYLTRLFGLKEEQTACLDDSSLDAFTPDSLACAPANANKKVQEFVLDKYKKDGSGYLSANPGIQGQLDILETILRINMQAAKIIIS